MGNPVKNFTDSPFFSTSSMKIFRFNVGLLLSSFGSVLFSDLVIKFCYNARCNWLKGRAAMALDRYKGHEYCGKERSSIRSFFSQLRG